MIPLILKIKNFLSYGSELQTIDFEPHSLICLSGKNGHGKSALLDAMTWALWGQARKVSGTAKSDDALLHIGQTQMIVIFDFICNNQSYRIRREFMKTYGKPITSLEFGLFDKAKNTFISLSDKTIRSTQKKIEQTLKLDFDSFINSAFLRQGQANEFSKKSPKERKEVLGKILGLNSFELIRKLAHEKARSAQLEKTSIDSLYEKIKQELESTSNVKEHLANITSQINELTKKILSSRTKQEQLKESRTKLINEKQKLQILNYQLKQLLQKEREEHDTLQTIIREWKTVHSIQLNMNNSLDLQQKKREIESVIQEHQKKQQKNIELKEKRLLCKSTLQKITYDLQKSIETSLQQQRLTIERLLIEKKHLEEIIADSLVSRKNQNDNLRLVVNELNEKTVDLNALKINHTEFDRMIKQFEKRKEFYQRFTLKGNLMQQELQNLQQKQTLTHNDSNPSCPLCEQNLSASRRRFLKKKFIHEEHFLKYQINKLARIVKNLKPVLIEQHKTIEKYKTKNETVKITQLKLEELTKKKNEIISAIQELENKIEKEQKKLTFKTNELSEQQKTLECQKKDKLITFESNPEIIEQKKSLEAYELQLNDIVYKPEEHENSHKQLKNIEEKINQYQKNLEQIALQEKRKQEIHKLCKTLKNYKKKKKVLNQKIIPFIYLEKRQQIFVVKENELEEQATVINKKKEALFQEKGKLDQQCKKRIELEKELTDYKNKIKQLNEIIEDYQTIATATGKDGIQALLIQEVIPEIEQEANMLLSKLTDNQAQIYIESLRDLKKGGTKETLDIKISDPIGMRPYELFSGGEAFRIDFALRIAISKLLAKRAGTSLQTLIIDEGFGSQDEEGLAYIMDAIYKIQDDFAKVIIVSHLTSMKELFPVHFMVEKSPYGSKIATFQQG